MGDEAMSGELAFAVLIRITGFWIAIYGMWMLAAGIYFSFFGSPETDKKSSEQFSPGAYFVWGAVEIFFGFMVISSADVVARSLY